ncbi:MAG TPA: hydroxyacid dehydrogenase [Phototrophicaceae bacterium]|jgi:D-3-phosphoglycerate dehydrogenase|nr:hydroxyacid dehydrogenase [Phototrophicaceae bacterium]
MSYNVIAADNVDKAAIDLLAQSADINIIAQGNLSRDQLLAVLPEADGLIIRSTTKADAALLEQAAKLKIIARAGVGVDNVDLNAATEKGIVVVNTPDGNTISTAEYTFGLMLALARHIAPAYQDLKEGRWERKAFTGVELKGKTLGIVGFGRIGRAVAKRALAFEMNIVAFDPYIAADIAEDFGARLVDLDTLFAVSDFITLHSVITDETKHMINAETIGKMKKGVRIVNAARGALINDADLAAAIKSGQVGGAALDVYTVEPPAADNPLIGLAGVLHTPHLAASTSDAQINVGVDAARLVVEGLTTGHYTNVCNPAVVQK